MNNSQRTFITAIKEIDKESFIASSLLRQGFIINHRAISPESLVNYCAENFAEEITILASENFLDPHQLVELSASINGKIEILRDIPTNDIELAELLRPTLSVSPIPLKPLPAHLQVIAIASLGCFVGASTIAINIAQELSLNGMRTLFLDANFRNCFASEHFGVFGLNRGIQPVHGGLSLFEISSDDWHTRISEYFSQFDRLVIDIGALFKVESSLSGRRMEDLLLQWVCRNAVELLIITDEERLWRSEGLHLYKQIESSTVRPELSLIINQTPPLARRDREKRSASVADKYARSAESISRDVKAFATMRQQSATLATASPKSRARNEILDICKRRNWWLS